jgi:outer membrane lipoprotein-sorting protein
MVVKKKMPKNLQLSITLLLTFLIVHALHAAPLKTLSLDFMRELTEQGKTEHTAGTLHYDVKTTRVVVEVTEPLKQIMVVKDKVLEIYYPVENQAFRFISEERIPLPFVESIVQSTQAEHGLTAVGYSLEKHDIVNEVLYSYWSPPKKAKDKLGTIILGMQDDRLISAEVKNPNGHIVARSHYQNHSKVGMNYVPMMVTSSTYGEKSEVLQYEHIVYSNPQVNVNPPNQILNFAIPESVEVKEVKW